MDFSALILDDGEFGTLRDVLSELDGAVAHRNSGRLTEHAARGHDLIVMTAKRAVDSESNMAAAKAPLPPRIVIHNQDFLPMRERMRKIGVDFLVNSNVCPDTLAHVIRSAVFRGEDRRAGQRSAVGAQIPCKIGGARVALTLAEIGPLGCRLIGVSPAVRTGLAVLEIPADLGGGAPTQLIGQIGRIDECLDESGDRRVVAIEFGALSHHAKFLTHLRAGGAVGARVTSFEREALHTQSVPARSERIAATASELAEHGQLLADLHDTLAEPPKERRHSPRGTPKRKFVAIVGSDVHTIVGCDLSRHAARVEWCSELRLGDKLKLGIPGRPPEEPLLVDGVVARDDGGRGLVVRFDVTRRSHVRWLDRLIASLPPVITEHEGLA